MTGRLRLLCLKILEMELFQGSFELEGGFVEVVVRDECPEERDHSLRGFPFRRIIELFNQAIFGGTHLFFDISYVKYNFM